MNLDDYTDNLYEKIVARIREERQKQGKTQKEVAEALGLNPVTYADMENGKTRFSVVRLLAILKFLGFNKALITEFSHNSSENIKDLTVIDDFESFLEKFLQQNQAIIQLQTNDEKLQQDVSEIKSLLQEILIKLNEKP